MKQPSLFHEDGYNKERISSSQGHRGPGQPSNTEPNTTKVDLHGSSLLHCPDFLSKHDSAALFNTLVTTLPWQQPSIRVYGRITTIPRLQVWMGDQTSAYMYSGKLFKPEPWRQEIIAVKQNLEALAKHAFNSVLINLYRDGQDSVSWHSDNEPELNDSAPIASLSLGATRRFDLRRTDGPDKQIKQIELADGDALVMSPTVQHYWQHQIPKQTKVTEPRINLTFRCVNPS